MHYQLVNTYMYTYTRGNIPQLACTDYLHKACPVSPHDSIVLVSKSGLHEHSPDDNLNTTFICAARQYVVYNVYCIWSILRGEEKFELSYHFQNQERIVSCTVWLRTFANEDHESTSTDCKRSLYGFRLKNTHYGSPLNCYGNFKFHFFFTCCGIFGCFLPFH